MMHRLPADDSRIELPERNELLVLDANRLSAHCLMLIDSECNRRDF